MKKRAGEVKSENADRWLLTYADMITLLMAFFIMMYSMSVLNTAKFRQAAMSIRSGFNGMTRGQGRSVSGTSGMFSTKPSPIEGDTAGVSWRVLRPLVDYVENMSGKGGGDRAMQIGEDQRGIVITLSSDALLFDSGDAKLRRQAMPILGRVAKLIGQTENPVQIEGHTCNLPVRGGKYPTNWELSTARATNVLRYLVEAKGLSSWRFSASGYGSARPIVPNDTALNRMKNRRVEIVLVRPQVAMQMVDDNNEPRRITDPSQASIRRRLN